MSNVFRVVARIGLFARAKFAGLIAGEIGWATDRKVAFFGDDTNDPPQVATHKSTGEITYSDQFTPIFANVGIQPNGKVAGVPLGKLNNPGLMYRGVGVDDWANRVLEGDEYIQVIVPEGDDEGPIIIKATQALIDKLKSSNLRYYYGVEPPPDARPGDMWLSETDEIVYLRVGAGDDEADHIWLDFTSFSGGGGGVKFFYSEVPPETAQLGDEWLEKGEGSLYKYLTNASDNLSWVEQV